MSTYHIRSILGHWVRSKKAESTTHPCQGCDFNGRPRSFSCKLLANDPLLTGCQTIGGTPITWHRIVSREEREATKQWKQNHGQFTL